MSAPANAVMVPMQVQWQPGWLTWVAATTSCLRALGHDCDTVDVAGMSGYAFILSVHKELCPSGPTVFDWYTLLEGVQRLGRSTLNFASGDCHCEGHISDRTRAHCHAAYALVAEEVAAGRPCVIWGAYVPEFAVAVGVEDGAFHVVSYRRCTGEPEPPIPCEELNAPGGPYALGFPTVREVDRARSDAWAVTRAAQIANQPRYFRDYGYGVAAYDMWIAALQSGQLNSFGNAYNTVCLAEGRHFAHEFLSRIAGRNVHLAEPLRPAVEAYAQASAAMHEVGQLFPFPGQGEAEDPARRAEAVEHLHVARAAEAQAAKALAAAAMALPEEGSDASGATQ